MPSWVLSLMLSISNGQNLAGQTDIPAALHPIKQDAVLLTRANPEARGFFDFLTTPQAKAIIAANGYQIPFIAK